jgi:hypothetical protein
LVAIVEGGVDHVLFGAYGECMRSERKSFLGMLRRGSTGELVAAGVLALLHVIDGHQHVLRDSKPIKRKSK